MGMKFVKANLLHGVVSQVFVAASTLRLIVAACTGVAPTAWERTSLAVLTFAVPLTALHESFTSPPRWRGVFQTSACTAVFAGSALILGDNCVNAKGELHPALLFAWTLAVVQFVLRCFNYHYEVADASKSSERESFFGMCSFRLGSRLQLPCTILNQGYMLLIYSKLQTSAGSDLTLALAFSDFLCVYQLLLTRKGCFPTEHFVDGAAIISGLPASVVFASHGQFKEAVILCSGLAVWLLISKVSPSSNHKQPQC